MNKTKSRKYAYSSLRQFSWSGKKNKDTSEQLIESTVLEWYEAKHRKISIEELNFINNIKITSCPFCNGTVMKNGHRKPDGIQKYKCSKCNKSFMPLTGTIFDNKKIPISEWIEYLTHLFEFHSIRTSSNDNRNASTTGTYWLRKVFSVLENVQDGALLDGTIYLDETYLPIIESKKKLFNNKKLIGISKDKLCIGTAINDKNQSVLFYLKRGKPTDKSIYHSFKNHIKEGSTLIHDGELAHNILVDELLLKSVVYNSKELKGLKDKDNPLDKINNLHSLFKKFMKQHGGYDRNNIQDWLNLFWFIVNGPEDKNDKVKIFLEMAIKHRKILRYREVMQNK